MKTIHINLLAFLFAFGLMGFSSQMMAAEKVTTNDITMCADLDCDGCCDKCDASCTAEKPCCDKCDVAKKACCKGKEQKCDKCKAKCEGKKAEGKACCKDKAAKCEHGKKAEEKSDDADTKESESSEEED